MKIKSHRWALTTFALLINQCVFAQAPISITCDWAGAYAGASVGAHTLNLRLNDPDSYSDYELVDDKRMIKVGTGLNIGYNWQRNHFVYGAEASARLISSKSISKDHSGSAACSHLKNVFGIKVKAGLALGSSLLYLAIGPSISQSTLKMIHPDGGPNAYGNTHTNRNFGLTTALGIGHNITEKLSLRMQVENTQLKTSPISHNSVSIHHTDHLIEATIGLNYHL